MAFVNHKIWGMGTVIKREVTKDGKFIEVSEGGNYITARFANGKEARFAIPASFEKDIITPVGALNDEVEVAIAKSRACEEKRKSESLAGTVTHGSTPKRTTITKKSLRTGKSTPTSVKGPIEEAYEEYLIKAGYRTETENGALSTVYSYINAIRKHVLESEGISWGTLKNDIENIVKTYGKGGAKERIGSMSNNTVICALKCFESLVISNFDTVA
jgi:hypothetical protein